MLEAIKHLFGICGEGHPSILYGLGILPIILGFRGKITSYLKTLLQRFWIGCHPNKKQF